MTLNMYASGDTPLLHIRCMGCNRLPDTVKVAPMLRNSYIVHYVVKGRGFYNGSPVEKGQGFLIYPGHVVEYHADPQDPWELLWIVSEDPNMAPLFQSCHADSVSQVFSYDFVPAVSDTMDTLVMLTRTVQRPSVLLELFLRIWNHHDRDPLRTTAQSKAQTYVEFALDYIHTNYQSPVSVEDLAELLGVSQPYLFRIFKAVTGKSPKTYLGDYRLLQAKKLLAETKLTVTEVANSVGYPDALAFSRFFSKNEGTSPRAYRQTLLTDV